MATDKAISPATGNPGAAPGAGTSAPVAVAGQPTPAANAAAAPALPVAVPAKDKSTVIAFGGDRGGRPRLDGLVPGSEEARKADLEKKRIAEQRRRDRLRAAEQTIGNPPPPLPARSATTPPPLGGSPEAPVQGPAGALVMPGTEWTAVEAQPIVVTALPLIEHVMHAGSLRKLAELKAPASLLNEVRATLAWPVEAKRSLEMTLPAPTAKMLNAAGVPNTFKEEISCLPAIALLIQHERSASEKLDKIIAELRNQRKADAEAKP